MQHALDLARKATGLASPNPLVGCVIVQNGEIVGQGFHEYDGRSHAEVLALRAAGEKARGATLYVTLEPCNHTGRTGPCSEAVIAAGVKRVVAAMQDPNPAVSGGGFAKMRDAGIEVESGLLEEQARGMNEAFACWILTHQPFVTLKSALTLDGQLAWPQSKTRNLKAAAHQPSAVRASHVAHTSSRVTNPAGAPNAAGTAWITSEESRAEVQRMRHASDALLTGIGTILADDPLLTDRSGLPRRRRLLRVILDTKLRLSCKARILGTVEQDLLVFTATSLKSPKARKLQVAGVELVSVKSRNGKIDLNMIVKELGRREILSVLLECGPKLNATALTANIVHKLVLFYAPKIAGKTAVPFIHSSTSNFPHLDVRSVQQFGPDVAIEATPRS